MQKRSLISGSLLGVLVLAACAPQNKKDADTPLAVRIGEDGSCQDLRNNRQLLLSNDRNNNQRIDADEPQGAFSLCGRNVSSFVAKPIETENNECPSAVGTLVGIYANDYGDAVSLYSSSAYGESFSTYSAGDYGTAVSFSGTDYGDAPGFTVSEVSSGSGEPLEVVWLCEGGEQPTPEVPAPEPLPETGFGAPAPVSQGAAVALGQRDDIGSDGSNLGPVTEYAMLYGWDRQLSWDQSLAWAEGLPAVPSSERVILQAFNMSYEHIRKQLPEIAKAGYTTLQLSPPTPSLNKYGIWWELYQPTAYAPLSNRLGDEKELRTLIAEAHSLGMQVIADTVLNHMADPKRFESEGPLHYGETFEPKDFRYYEFYLARVAYETHVREQGLKVDDASAEAFFLSPAAALYTAFTQAGGQSPCPAGNVACRAKEVDFLKAKNPYATASFESALEAQGYTGQANQASLYLDLYNRYFGKSAFIIRPYFYDIHHDGQGPAFVNEWDMLDRAWNKWFPGLPELNTESPEVQAKQVALLENMVRIGFDGFRLDAIKHVNPETLKTLFAELSTRIKANDAVVDGQKLSEKGIYYYAEMATSKTSIANFYRQDLDVTDFFLTDSIAFHMNTPERDPKGKGIQALRKTKLEADRELNSGVEWQMSLRPGSVESERPLAELDSWPVSLSRQTKQSVVFSRLHDTVVGTMYKIYDYSQAILGQAYIMAAAEGQALVYASDEDILRNAGADYKEPLVTAGLYFRQKLSGVPYADALDYAAYCKDCNTPDLLFVDRGDQGLAIFHAGYEAKSLTGFSFANLKAGCYRELLSRRVFKVDASGRAPSLGATLDLAPRSVSYVIPEAQCSAG